MLVREWGKHRWGNGLLTLYFAVDDCMCLAPPCRQEDVHVRQPSVADDAVENDAICGTPHRQYLHDVALPHLLC